MSCPHCSRNFQLTWSRYARSFLGRHTFLHCGKQSTFRATLPYIALLLVAWGIVFAAAIAIRSAAFPAHPHARPTPLWFAAVFALGSLVLLPLDKFYDARFRKLRKLRCDTLRPNQSMKPTPNAFASRLAPLETTNKIKRVETWCSYVSPAHEPY